MTLFLKLKIEKEEIHNSYRWHWRFSLSPKKYADITT